MQGTFTNLALEVRFRDNDKKVVLEFTMDSVYKIDMAKYPTATEYRLVLKRKSNNVACTGVCYPMLNIGSTKLPYEKYEQSILNIPEEVQNINGYGNGISSSCYNYITWKPNEEIRTFTKYVEQYNFTGEEKWSLGAYTNKSFPCFETEILQNKKINSTMQVVPPFYFIGNSLNTLDAYQVMGSNEPNKTKYIKICVPLTLLNFGINATEFELVRGFKAYLKEKHAIGKPISVLYELEEPIVENITSILSDDNMIKTFSNGTITMLNNYSLSIPSTIMYQNNN